MTQEDIKSIGFCKQKFEASIFLSFRFIDDKITRVTITSNPWGIMAKQGKGEEFYFMPILNENNAVPLANTCIVAFQTGQHLFGILTLRQAAKMIKGIGGKFSRELILKEIASYNEFYKTQERIWLYGCREYVSKRIVEGIIDKIEFANYERKIHSSPAMDD